MKFLFLCVHPDDLEFNCANLMRDLVSKGKKVEVLSLTKGEFGIMDANWKGPRLANIRVKELEKAAGVSGIQPKFVHFGEIIDGFVRFNRENIESTLMQINKIQPDIIFAPEGYFTYYWHPDHINCGRIAYYIFTKQQARLEHPIQNLYFYTTSKPNFYWPFNDASHGSNALFQHQSQWWLLKWNKLIYPLEKHNFSKGKLGRWKMTERYRKITRNHKEPRANLLTRSILGLICNLNVINPPDPHFQVPDRESPFGKEIQKLRKKYNFKE
jgi:N,N'-diacetylchitobiose non-reducing end deacetylase